MSLPKPSLALRILLVGTALALIATLLPANAAASPVNSSPSAASSAETSPDSPSQHSAFMPRSDTAQPPRGASTSIRTGPAVTAGCTYDWSVVNTGITYTGDTWLNAVAGTSDSDVWVVGGQRSGVGTGLWQTLVEHFNGTSWSIVPSPNSGTGNNNLYGVAALSPTDVWAVGFARPNNYTVRGAIALHWNGSGWTTYALPRYNPYVGSHTAYSVWMTSTSDVWVSGYFIGEPDDPAYDDIGAVWHWDGSSWSMVASDTGLSVVSGVSGSQDGLWGAGYFQSYSSLLAGYANLGPYLGNGANNIAGSSWSFAMGIAGKDAGGHPFHPVAVGAFGTGGYEQTLVENYNGSTWGPTPTPNLSGTFDNYLQSVTAITSTDEWAVGSASHSAAGGTHDYPLELHYSGANWQVGSDSTRGDTASDFNLIGVGAVTPTSVYAVGQNFDTYAYSTRIEKLCVTPPDSFTVSAPSSSVAGSSFSVTATAMKTSSTMTGYRGTVHFSSTDPQAVLPADYAYQAADNGVHSFTVTLKTAGSQTITASDVSSSASGADTMTVTPAPASRLSLAAPADAAPNAPLKFTVTAKDTYGNTATAYAGTVHFVSDDPGSPTLPADSTLSSGTGSFSATLQTLGTRTLTATDTVTASLNGTGSVLVARQFDMPSVQQYELDNSDGATWQEMDSALRLSFAPASNQEVVLGANSDLWTATAGYNQDLGIFASVDGGADQLLGWKESGGFAGTFSPNAAYLAVPYLMFSGHS